jgi:hypothetical protein
MKFGILVLFMALVIGLLLTVGKSRQENPVRQGVAALEKTKTVATELDMDNVSAAISAYFGDHGGYPERLDALVPNYLPSADSIIDSWGTPLRLEKDEPQDAVLLSAGPDRTFATADDIKRRP